MIGRECGLGRDRDAGESIVALDEVKRAFDGGAITALDGVSLRFGRRELVAVLGPSGSGKSTLLNLMAGLDTPSEGAVVFDGHRSPTAEAWTALRARRIGLVFQDFNLLPRLTASENVQVAMFGAGLRAGERRRRAEALLEEVGVGDCAARLPPQLSGGERQRVSIARSLANEPDLLLADEPTSSLDSRSGAAVTDLLISLREKRSITLVIVSHQPAMVERCPRRIAMMDGKVVSDER